MYFTEGNKADDVTLMVIKAVRSKRFEYNKYLAPRKFHSILCQAELLDESNGWWSVKVYSDVNTVKHVIVQKHNTYIDGVPLRDALIADAEEIKNIRKNAVEPLLKIVEERLSNIFTDINRISGNDNNSLNTHTIDLLEYCVAPGKTEIGTEHNSNANTMVKILVEKLRHYMMAGDDTRLSKLQKVVDMIHANEM